MKTKRSRSCSFVGRSASLGSITKLSYPLSASLIPLSLQLHGLVQRRHRQSDSFSRRIVPVRGRADTQSVENVPIINLPRSQCSARMQRTSATCYFAYNDAAVHANARNHPGDDIKRDRRRHPPPRRRFASRGLSYRSPAGTGHDGEEKDSRGERKRRKWTGRFSSRDREARGRWRKKVRKMIPITCRGMPIVVPRKITSVPL